MLRNSVPSHHVYPVRSNSYPVSFRLLVALSDYLPIEKKFSHPGFFIMEDLRTIPLCPVLLMWFGYGQGVTAVEAQCHKRTRQSLSTDKPGLDSTDLKRKRFRRATSVRDKFTRCNWTEIHSCHGINIKQHYIMCLNLYSSLFTILLPSFPYDSMAIIAQGQAIVNPKSSLGRSGLGKGDIKRHEV